MIRKLLFATALSLASLGAGAQTLRVGVIGQEIGSLDPHRATTSQDKGTAAWAFDGLLRFPPGSADPAAVEPDLAERVQTSPDGLTLTFTLRPNVVFSDGSPLTAEVAAASLRRAMDRTRSSFAADYRAVSAIDVTGPLTLSVTLKEPVPGVMGLFANYHGGMIVNEAGLGTGPFRIESAISGRVRMVANDRHWRGRPALRELDVRYIPSDQTRELAYQAGELDLITGRREQRWVERMRGLPNTTVHIFGPGEFRTLLINGNSPPLNDIRVRRAVQHALDVNAISRFVGTEVARPWAAPVPPGYLGSADITRPAFDQARARALLAEAGHPNGITLRAVVSSISAQLPIMEVIQAQLRRANIRLEMDVVEHATYHQRIREDLSQLTFYGAARFPVADAWLSQFYHSAAAPGRPTMSLNFAHCAAADAEIEAARTATDSARQIALWAEAQRKITDAACSVPLFDLRQVWVRRSNVELGYELTGALNLAPAITHETRLR
ncbi:polyamine ABC transporter substrate-binding protein [Rhodovarius crocodyli]|uniref:Polyamine ABC transporter substrate-binding protein n=1 Tax=Rhodovarius crocodyli TaxID=1979269 RepID=A0A437MED1_9PROT|nr:ABC transporter substrate-binding protein [Rhodovarius crocodyli]RVT95972.1 polyamine ABC transporter substrate-binding protein [Rhodovarius crocodyli]